jgi:EmrB/QacA subfamily drug resistance transporter
LEYKWVVLSNTTIAVLMASLDSNIVLIALPTIAKDLRPSIFVLLWILIGYGLITAVVLLNFGRFSDMYGRVKLYNLGLAIFTGGSALCGFSQSGIELVVFRMIQAIGAGFLFSNSAAIITDAFPPNERGTAIGINQVSIVVGSVSGLVLGGFLTKVAGWPSIFFVNVPIGIIAFVWSRSRLKEIGTIERGQKIDYLGNITFAVGLSLLLLGVTLGALGAVDQIGLVAYLGVGTAMLVAFGYVETKITQPMFDLRLFKNHVFTGQNIALFLNSLARGGFSFVLVFYLQGPPHILDALTAGLYLVPVSVSLAILGPISGRLSDRHGPRVYTISGLIISSIGFLLLTTIGPTTGFVDLVLPFALVGAGMGLFASPNRAAIMNAVPPNRRGVASGISTTLVNAGITFSLGFAISVMASVLPLSSLKSIFLFGQNNSSQSLTAAVIANFMNSIHLVFYISTALLVISIVPSLIKPEKHPGNI